MSVDFHNSVERQLSSRLISFQSDWGGEFQALSQYLKQHGIIHRVSCPHTPEKNDTAERKHRHIIETYLSLLIEAKMPSKFWDETVSTAIHLINRLPTPVLKKDLPLKYCLKNNLTMKS